MRQTNTYGDYAVQYAAYVARGSGPSTRDDPFGLIPRMIDLLEPLAGQVVLDAGCGEGVLGRALRHEGARVVAADIAAPLVDLAKARDPAGDIEFHVRDLSRPVPEWRERFDAIGSRFVLNDVPDYRGFISTLAAVLKPGGRAALAFNNPYSAVLRGKVDDYFDTGTVRSYDGLAREGIDVFHVHRTMAEYVDAFRDAGFELRKLVDLPRARVSKDGGSVAAAPTVVPFLTIVSLRKRAEDAPAIIETRRSETDNR